MADDSRAESILTREEVLAIRNRLPLIVALGCLLLTLAVSRQLSDAFTATERSRMNALSDGVVQDFDSRLTAYEVMLRAAASFIANDPDFARASFVGFVDGSNLLKVYPGLRAVGYAEWISDQPDAKLVVRYLRPDTPSNQRARGRDLLSDPVRRQAVRNALESASPQATAPVKLLQDVFEGVDEPGFLMYAPVYDSSIPPVEGQRLSHVRGFVYLACRGSELVHTLYPVGPPAQFVARDNGQLLLKSAQPLRSEGSRFNMKRSLLVGGRSWDFELASLKETAWSADPIRYVWWIGVVSSIILSGLVALEIRGRVRAEKVTGRLTASEMALNVSEERYRLFVASSPDAIWRLELDEPLPCSLDTDAQIDWLYERGTLGECNDVFAQMCGRHEAHEMHDAPLSAILDPAEEWTHVLLLSFINAGYQVARFESESGAGPDLDVRLHSLVGDVRNGTLTRAWGIVRSVSAERLAQRKVQDLNEELEHRVEQRTRDLTESNRELESFAYSVSHDLRTPLRGMAGFSQILEEDYGDRLGEEGLGYLQRIRSAAVKLAALIDGLLQLSRLARVELKLQSVDLSAISNKVVSEARLSGELGNATVSVQVGMIALSDPVLIEVLIQNLIGNALKFSSGRPNPQIEVGFITIDGADQFFVRDNGVGFDPAYADRLFRPFERLHRDTDFPGTGIGLATVQRIVWRHGGQVSIEGIAQRGATVRFTLG